MSGSEVLILLTTRRLVYNISIFYWTQDGTLDGVEFYEEDGFVSWLSETTESDGLVYRRIYSHSGFVTGYLRVNFIGTNSVAITEIEVIHSEGSNLLGPVLDTSRFTIPSSRTSIAQTFSVSTTATITTTTTIIPSTSPSMMVTTTTTTNPTINLTPTPTSQFSTTSATTPVTPTLLVPSSNTPLTGTIIGVVLAVLLIFLVVLVAVLVVVAFLLVRRRRQKSSEGKVVHRKEFRSSKLNDENGLGLYDPINQDTGDREYENPEEVSKGARGRKGYSSIAMDGDNDDKIYSEVENKETLSKDNEWYEKGEDLNIYARPAVSIRTSRRVDELRSFTCGIT